MPARVAVAVLPDDDADVLLGAAAFRRSRRAMEANELDRLAADLPLPQVVLPARAAAGLDAADIDALAGTLGERT